MHNSSIQPEQRTALTLVELLVALAILTLVSALLVPRLRIINKERNIREAARVAGSVFSSARDRAILDGAAGVVIERNLNFVSTTGSGRRVYYAGSRLYEMRALPPYAGDSDNDFAFVIWTFDASGNEVLRCYIPQPLEHEPATGQFLVNLGDEISLRGTRFRIRNVLPVVEVTFTNSTMINGQDVSSPYFMLPLELDFDDDQNPGNIMNLSGTDLATNRQLNRIHTDVDGSGNASPFPNSVSSFDAAVIEANFLYPTFTIHRMRKRESSVVNLPQGYLIDLRYSGPTDNSPCPMDPTQASGLDCDFDTGAVFGLGLNPFVQSDPTTHETAPFNRDIQILFDSKGAIDKILFNGNNFLAGQSMYFFINEFDPSIGGNARVVAQTLLSQPDSLWLTVGFNGGVNIGYNGTPFFDPNDPISAWISGARDLSRSRTSASQ